LPELRKGWVILPIHLAGIILAWFGFVANEVQTDAAMMGIRTMFSIFPAVIALPGIIAIYFYRIDSTMLKTMEKDLLERHGTAV
jgi:GPH family glycoside/pentoside/hexuronide:cation symporter